MNEISPEKIAIGQNLKLELINIESQAEMPGHVDRIRTFIGHFQSISQLDQDQFRQTADNETKDRFMRFAQELYQYNQKGVNQQQQHIAQELQFAHQANQTVDRESRAADQIDLSVSRLNNTLNSIKTEQSQISQIMSEEERISQRIATEINNIQPQLIQSEAEVQMVENLQKGQIDEKEKALLEQLTKDGKITPKNYFFTKFVNDVLRTNRPDNVDNLEQRVIAEATLYSLKKGIIDQACKSGGKLDNNKYKLIDQLDNGNFTKRAKIRQLSRFAEQFSGRFCTEPMTPNGLVASIFGEKEAMFKFGAWLVRNFDASREDFWARNQLELKKDQSLWNDYFENSQDEEQIGKSPEEKIQIASNRRILEETFDQKMEKYEVALLEKQLDETTG